MAADTPAPTDKRTKPEVSKSQKGEEEEDDWLAGALSRKKALSGSKQEDCSGLEEEVDLESIVRYCRSHTQQRKHNDRGSFFTE